MKCPNCPDSPGAALPADGVARCLRCDSVLPVDPPPCGGWGCIASAEHRGVYRLNDSGPLCLVCNAPAWWIGGPPGYVPPVPVAPADAGAVQQAAQDALGHVASALAALADDDRAAVRRRLCRAVAALDQLAGDS
jgi:hypothetical protein